MNGHELDRAETSVDASNELVDCRAQVLVFLDILARGYGKLRKDNLADPFRMLCQEELERVQLLRDTLDVVEPVDTDDDLDTVEAVLELLDTFLNAVLLEVLSNDTWSKHDTREQDFRDVHL